MPYDNRILEEQLRRIVPEARIVRIRHLRRAISEFRDAGSRLASNPHLPHWFPTSELRELNVLSEEIRASTTDSILALSEPNDRGLDRHTEDQILIHYWKLLYAGKLEIDLKSLGEGELARRWYSLPEAVRVDASFLLAREHDVATDPEPHELFVAFARRLGVDSRFQPSTIAYDFPRIQHKQEMIARVFEGVN